MNHICEKKLGDIWVLTAQDDFPQIFLIADNPIIG